MKHVFIVNPKAGKKNYTNIVTEKLKKYEGVLDYEVYITKGPKDANNYVSKYLQNYHDEVRFYSCGGDGTLNEVLNGMANYQNASLACFACGSGNDFIKYFGKVEDFLNLDELITGEEVTTDIIKVANDYCINICNFGFDAEVCDSMAKFKKLPLVSGKMSYTLGVIDCLLFKMKHYIKIWIDGELFFDGPAMLCAIANGICYGGGYYCCPNAKLDDGILDICLVSKVSRIKAAPLIKLYKVGEHLNNEKLKDIIHFKQGKKVRVESEHGICYVNDGEVKHTKELEIEVIKDSLRFVVPKRLLKVEEKVVK